MGLSSWIAHKSVWSPQNIAVRFGAREITYAQFERRIAHLAGYLVDRQRIGVGDRVAYLGPNAPELLDVFFACARVRAIFVPLNSRMTAKQVAILLTNCRPRCMFVHTSFRTIAEAACGAIDGLQLIAFADDSAVSDDALLDVDKLATTERPIVCNPPAGQDIPVLIAYTSGTTGIPKGALYTQDAITFSAINSNTSFNMRSRDHVLTFLPMFHVGGLLIQTLPAFHVGATVTIHRAFDPGEVLREIHERGVTLILPPPAMSKAMSSHPTWPKVDLRSVRCVAIGSTIVPPEIMQPWFDLNVPTQQLYGLTEGVPVLAAPWEHARRKSRAVGTSVLYCEARVVGQDFQPQTTGMRGEIVLRGRSLFKEYWENPEATRAAFVDGWFRTGDVGYTDPEGYFYVVDRIKNIVIVGSSNVYPIDLEVVLADCDDIDEAAVVGCPDVDTGEALVACVVLKKERRMTEVQVRALFRGRLADYQHPRHVLFMESLPKTSLGKVQKSELTTLAEQRVGQRRG